mmetsp:Transcript_80525/g.249853  ORF Transcript_80525/g.249853 Transcript_80525/m.249853 type:complete len:225 (+) Transcript_80525:7-681(+)
MLRHCPRSGTADSSFKLMARSLALVWLSLLAAPCVHGQPEDTVSLLQKTSAAGSGSGPEGPRPPAPHTEPVDKVEANAQTSPHVKTYSERDAELSDSMRAWKAEAKAYVEREVNAVMQAQFKQHFEWSETLRGLIEKDCKQFVAQQGAALDAQEKEYEARQRRRTLAKQRSLSAAVSLGRERREGRNRLQDSLISDLTSWTQHFTESLHKDVGAWLSNYFHLSK